MAAFLIVVKIITSIFAVIWNLIVKIINVVVNAINKNIRKRNDRINRGVVETKHTSVESLIPEFLQIDNLLISGGSDSVRAEFISQSAKNAQAQGYATIVLHENNRYLVQQLTAKLNKTNFVVIDSYNPVFEPFFKLSTKEIIKTLFDIATDDYDLKKNGSYYIEGMCDFLNSKKARPTLRNFNSCPHFQLFDKIDNLVLNGVLTDVKGQEIKSKLMMGQSEQFKIESLVSDFYDQSESILFASKKQPRYSILRSIMKNDVLSIDISSNVNTLLINSIISQLRQAINKGKHVVLITDNLTMAGNATVKRIMTERTGKCKLIASSVDALSMCDGDEKSFSTLVGNSEQIIILGHASGATCTKWAETIGYYNKQEESQSYEKGSMKHSPFTLFPGSNNATTKTYNIKREYIVKPEMINRMAQNEVYSYDHRKNQLLHSFI